MEEGVISAMLKVPPLFSRHAHCTAMHMLWPCHACLESSIVCKCPARPSLEDPLQGVANSIMHEATTCRVRWGTSSAQGRC